MTDPIKYVYAFVKGEKILRTLKMRKEDATDSSSAIAEIMKHKYHRVFKQNTRKVKVPTGGRHIR